MPDQKNAGRTLIVVLVILLLASVVMAVATTSRNDPMNKYRAADEIFLNTSKVEIPQSGTISHMRFEATSDGKIDCYIKIDGFPEGVGCYPNREYKVMPSWFFAHQVSQEFDSKKYVEKVRLQVKRLGKEISITWLF